MFEYSSNSITAGRTKTYMDMLNTSVNSFLLTEAAFFDDAGDDYVVRKVKRETKDGVCCL